MSKDLKIMTQEELDEFYELQRYFGKSIQDLVKIARYTALAQLLATEETDDVEKIRDRALVVLRFFHK